MSRTPDSPDGDDIVVRPAFPSDAAALRRIAQWSEIDAWTADQYREEIESENTSAFVCVDDDAIVGFILGRTVPGAEFYAEGEIYNIAVMHGARRKGIGRTLLARAVEVWEENRCGCVWLEVRASNHGAVQFYENNGFSKFSVRRNFYSDPVEDALIMRLGLTEKLSLDRGRIA